MIDHTQHKWMWYELQWWQIRCICTRALIATTDVLDITALIVDEHNKALEAAKHKQRQDEIMIDSDLGGL